ncbi:hypothetical protein ACKWTF_006448 [Chironomus riparius]
MVFKCILMNFRCHNFSNCYPKMNIIKDEEFDEAFNHLGSDFGFEKNIKRNSNYFNRFRYFANQQQNISLHLIILNKISGLPDNNIGRGQMTQRQYERKQREALKSSHGPTAETHDQVNKFKTFYLMPKN